MDSPSNWRSGDATHRSEQAYTRFPVRPSSLPVRQDTFGRNPSRYAARRASRLGEQSADVDSTVAGNPYGVHSPYAYATDKMANEYFQNPYGANDAKPPSQSGPNPGVQTEAEASDHQPAKKGSMLNHVFVVLVIIGLVLTVVAIGVGIGVGLTSKSGAASQAAATSLPPATNTSTTNTSTASVMMLPTAGDCPANDRVQYTAANGKKFLRLCGVDYAGKSEAKDIESVMTGNFSACMDRCAAHNDCTAVGWGVVIEGEDVGGRHECSLKKGLNVSHTTTEKWNFAMLLADVVSPPNSTRTMSENGESAAADGPEPMKNSASSPDPEEKSLNKAGGSTPEMATPETMGLEV